MTLLSALHTQRDLGRSFSLEVPQLPACFVLETGWDICTPILCPRLGFSSCGIGPKVCPEHLLHLGPVESRDCGGDPAHLDFPSPLPLKAWQVQAEDRREARCLVSLSIHPLCPLCLPPKAKVASPSLARWGGKKSRSHAFWTKGIGR